MERTRQKLSSSPPTPARLRELLRELGASIPAAHGGNRIILAPVNPRRAYLSWHVDPGSIEALRSQLGQAFAGARCLVRIHDVTDLAFDGSNAQATYPFSPAFIAGHSYWPVPAANRRLLPEVGFLLADGSFLALARGKECWFDSARLAQHGPERPVASGAHMGAEAEGGEQLESPSDPTRAAERSATERAGTATGRPEARVG